MHKVVVWTESPVTIMNHSRPAPRCYMFEFNNQDAAEKVAEFYNAQHDTKARYVHDGQK